MDDEGSLTYSATSGGSSNQDSIDSSLMGRACMDDSQETKELEQLLRQQGISPSLMDPTDQDHPNIPRTISRGSSNNGEQSSSSDFACSINMASSTPTTPTNHASEGEQPAQPLQFTIARAPPPTKHRGSKRARTRKKKSQVGSGSSATSSSSSPARKPPRPTSSTTEAVMLSHTHTHHASQETQLSSPQEAWYAKPWMCGFADALQLEGVLPTVPKGQPTTDKPTPF